MKFVDEFRDPAAARKLLAAIEHLAGRRLRRTSSSWRCAAGTRTPSTGTASNTCCPTTSNWSTARAVRSA